LSRWFTNSGESLCAPCNHDVISIPSRFAVHCRYPYQQTILLLDLIADFGCMPVVACAELWYATICRSTEASITSSAVPNFSGCWQIPCRGVARR
jgi:hypothetical protein